MLRFEFRLQRILELREREEQASQQVLAALQRRHLSAQESLRQVRIARDAHDDHCALDPGRPLTALDLRARLATTAALEAAEAQARRQAQQTAAEMERGRAALVEAHRRVQVLQRLRERAHRRWAAELRTQERKIMDDTHNRSGIVDLRAATPARRSR